MGMFTDQVVGQTKDVLKQMRDPVALTYFTQEMECEPCTSVSGFVDDLAAIESRLSVQRKDFVKDRELAEETGIHHIPALVLHRPDDGRPAVRYYGLPAGYEFGAFLRTLVLFSGGLKAEKVDPAMAGKIEKDINIKVFVLTTCPSCPVMAYLANTLAFLSPRVTTEIIEANAFIDLSTKFTVGTVPKIMINDTEEVLGVVPPDEFLRRLLSV